ncbi:envelope stress response membrane protein PspC [Sphingomonas astaxanthinifaciens]|uniref:Phage shock protein C n=1 Tax=Sphingomonas astaxanthinifaciens DSM 22298 TaxID=1123267 RepID=A0ABQ5Z911_9SPHN|nr:envelope stress response membrane protein PspC [Sphingomonas astaxanthinifaciens]GLR48422.1 phage shock protein C [Sphingomonas astaxanthinifaciens DSM 22298]
MTVQPATRTRFYKDKRNGKVMGVCAGIADYTGVDVVVVRILMFLALWLSGFSILPVYLIAGWIAEDRPRELAYASKDDQRFWQQVRASPARTAREIRANLKGIDRRLADVESYVLTSNRSLAREIDELR